MLVKIHKSYRDVIAICDSELLGKKFEETGKNTQLDLTGEFFRGEEKTEEETRELIEDALKEDAIFNIVGKQSISIALETGVIKKQGVIKIQGIPVALTLL